MADNKPEAIQDLEKKIGIKIERVEAYNLWESYSSYCMAWDGMITGLNLRECGISVLSPLAKLTGLKELRLNNNKFRDLSPLPH
ncbi:MAG TPA: leucine-rich repeat domain-containing protein [Candidatus Kapabacteria bacterium]|nr:leucine-rich repeat domain-containing protein [Candidatus Kapabacteria bacterium]